MPQLRTEYARGKEDMSFVGLKTRKADGSFHAQEDTPLTCQVLGDPHLDVVG